MGGLGMMELVLIFLVVLLVFGARRIPEIARGLGEGIREFKGATSEITRELTQEDTRQRINRTKAPRQGTPTPRSEAVKEAEAVPQEPARADNPGDAEASRQPAS